MSTMKIGIVGLGWIGTPLSNSLLKKGYKVVGTGTAKIPKESISSEVEYHKLNLEDSNYPLEVFEDCHSLILTIPPSSSHYVSGLKKFIEHFSDKYIVLLSSTGVYGSKEGHFTEDSDLHPERFGSERIAEVEKIIQEQVNDYSLVRLAGLVGPKRNPARFFKRSSTVPAPRSNCNLVHQSDAVRAIEFIIQLEKRPAIINVAAPFHPTKGEFYTKIAEVMGYEKPELNGDKGYERIVETPVLNDKGFKFKVTDFYDPKLYP